MRHLFAITLYTALGLLGVNAAQAQLTVQIGFNFTATTHDADNPQPVPDTMGAVGPGHIVHLINNRFLVYRKSDGVLLKNSVIDQFWTDAGIITSLPFPFDSRVLYDLFSQRWFLSSAHDTNILLAVSNSSDPTAGWKGFVIESGQGSVDFPMLGIDAVGVYTFNQFFGGLGQKLIVIPKADLLAPTPTVANTTRFIRTDIPFLHPTVNLDNTGLPFPLLFHDPGSALLWHFSISGSVRSPVLDTPGINISVIQYPPPPVAAQPPAPTQKPGIFCDADGASPVLRNGVIWGVEAVGRDGRVALRWFKVDQHTNALLQEGLVADNQLSFYCASIAVNSFGHAVIGFSASGTNQFGSSYAVVGETDSSGVTTFGKPLLLKAGADDWAFSRWGDYSATVVDPDNPLHFWTFQEWASGDDTWSTQITELILSRVEIQAPKDIKPPSNLPN